MDDISIAAALAASAPPEDGPPKAFDLWERLKSQLAEYDDISSHATEGVSYARDLKRSREMVLETYQAYKMVLATVGAEAGVDPLLLRRPRGFGVDFSGLAFHEL